MKTIARHAPRTAALLLTLALSSPVLAQPAPAPTPAPAPAPADPAASASQSIAVAGAAAEARTSALDARIAALFTPNGGLTSTEVAAKAAASSFDVRARHAELEAAAAAVDQAFVGYFPKLSVLARYARLSPIDAPSLGNLVGTAAPGAVTSLNQLVSVPFTFPVFLNQTTMQAALAIPLSDYVLRISQGYAAASHSEKAAEINERAAKQKAGLDGTIAYYNWARARMQVFVAQQALEAAKAHLLDAKHVYEAGSGSKADVVRAETQVASGDLLVQRAFGLSRLTEEMLRTAMHEATPRELTLGEDLRVSQATTGGATPLDALVAEALGKRLEVHALDETVWSLKEQAKVARAGYLPRLDAFGEVTYANPNQRIFPPADKFDATWSAGIQLSWTVNDIAAASAQGKQVDARAAQVTAQKGALMDALRMEVTQAELARIDAEAAVSITARALLSAEEGYRIRRELYKNGRATSVELTDAETELTRAELEVVNARVDLRLARARLSHALGRDVTPAAPAAP